MQTTVTVLMIAAAFGGKLNLPVMRRRHLAGRATSLAAAPVMTRLIRDNYAPSKRKRGPEKFIATIPRRERDGTRRTQFRVPLIHRDKV